MLDGVVLEAVESVVEECFDAFEEDDRAGVVERGAGGKVTVEGGDAHAGVRRDAFEGDLGVRAMRYSVDLVRYALFGTPSYDPRMWTAVTVLLFVGAMSVAIACAALYVRRVWRMKDLHPELTV